VLAQLREPVGLVELERRLAALVAADAAGSSAGTTSSYSLVGAGSIASAPRSSAAARRCAARCSATEAYWSSSSALMASASRIGVAPTMRAPPAGVASTLGVRSWRCSGVTPPKSAFCSETDSPPASGVCCALSWLSSCASRRIMSSRDSELVSRPPAPPPPAPTRGVRIAAMPLRRATCAKRRGGDAVDGGRRAEQRGAGRRRGGGGVGERGGLGGLARGGGGGLGDALELLLVEHGARERETRAAAARGERRVDGGIDLGDGVGQRVALALGHLLLVLGGVGGGVARLLLTPSRRASSSA
jgi:hypothetical protein